MNNIKFKLKNITEEDGSLVFLQQGREIPFEIERIFLISDVPEKCSRANHACKNAEFIFIALNGRVHIKLDNGNCVYEYDLATKEDAVYVPINTWISTSQFSKDAILLVLSSERYENSVYIDDYKEYIRSKGLRREL